MIPVHQPKSRDFPVITIVPDVGAFFHTYPGPWLFNDKSQALAPIVDDVADIDRRGGDEQKLRRWTDADFKRINMEFLSALPVGASAAQTAQLTTILPGLSGTNPMKRD